MHVEEIGKRPEELKVLVYMLIEQQQNYVLYVQVGFPLGGKPIFKMEYFGKGTEFLQQTQFFYLCIFATWWCKPLIFQTYIIWNNIIHSLKYLRSMILGCKTWFCDKDSIPMSQIFKWKVVSAVFISLWDTSHITNEN